MYLIVLFLAKLTPELTHTKPSPCDAALLAGSSVTIEAWSECTRPGMTYNWTQKGRGIPSYQYQTTSLVFNNVQPEDEGKYHLSYIHEDIGPLNPEIICTLYVQGKFF